MKILNELFKKITKRAPSPENTVVQADNRQINAVNPSFCVLPWKHLEITEAGMCRICCMVVDLLHDKNGKLLSIYTSPLEDIWNSDHMREIRHAMTHGNPIAACERFCGAVERSGGLSRRMKENQIWEMEQNSSTGLSLEDLRTDTIQNKFYVKYAPYDLDLELSNTCNYACRMCKPNSSSRIDHDSVHSKWTLRQWNMGEWKNNELPLWPNQLHQAMYKGCLAGIIIKDTSDDKSSGNAEIFISDINTHIDCLEIILPRKSVHHNIRVTANGIALSSTVEEQRAVKKLLFTLQAECTDLSLVFENIPYEPGANANAPWQCMVEKITLTRSPTYSTKTEIVHSRFPQKRHWSEEEDFLFGELFPASAQPKSLRIYGGEPLIIPSIVPIVQHLGSLPKAKDIAVQFVTNGSKYDDKLFAEAVKFKSTAMVISLDAAGKGIEYIRHGSKWETVKENMLRMRAAKNVSLIASCTLQAYNLLEFANLMRFCQEYELFCHPVMVVEPYWLSINVLPFSIRQTAAQRLQSLADEDKTSDYIKQHANAFAKRMTADNIHFEKNKLYRFMLFTNDLDRSRNQNIHDAFPELVKRLADDGHPWIDDTLHYKS